LKLEERIMEIDLTLDERSEDWWNRKRISHHRTSQSMVHEAHTRSNQNTEIEW
jgi:hypothetical protein